MAYSFSALYAAAKEVEACFENYFDIDYYKFLFSLNELCSISMSFDENLDFQEKVFKMAIMSQNIIQTNNIEYYKMINKKSFEHLITLTKMSIKKMILDTKLENMMKKKSVLNDGFTSDIKPSKKFRLSFNSVSENEEETENESKSASDENEEVDLTNGIESLNIDVDETKKSDGVLFDFESEIMSFPYNFEKEVSFDF